MLRLSDREGLALPGRVAIASSAEGSLTAAWLEQRTDNVTVFKIDQASGKLAQIGEPIGVPMSVCVKFIAAE